MKKTLFFLVFFLVASYNIYSQTKPTLFIEGNVNYSIIPGNEWASTPSYPNIPIMGGGQVYTNQSIIIDKYDSKPGFDFSVGSNFKVSKKLEVEAGIGVSLIRFRESHDININYSQNEPTFDSYINWYNNSDPVLVDSTSSIEPERPHVISNVNRDDHITELTYLNIPLAINYQIIEDKLKIGASYSTSILIKAHDVRTRLAVSHDPNGNLLMAEINEDSSLKSPYTPVLINLNVSLKYRFFKKLWLTCGFTQGITNIHNPNIEMGTHSYNAKNRLVNLGLRYEFSL